MQLGMLGLGRMGANIVRRLMKAGHECVVYNRSPAPVEELAGEGAIGSTDLDDFVSKLNAPRAVWVMVPAAVVDKMIDDLAERLQPGDIIAEANQVPVADVAALQRIIAQNTGDSTLLLLVERGGTTVFLTLALPS